VKEALIPKGKGEMRRLGIPTVLDRFIQQALLQVLQPLFDPTFSRHSYGFRPGRSAHEAIRAAQRHIQRCADDCNVHVRSRRAGERVMGWLRELFTGLHLKVNEAKSAVDLATRRKVLGYSFWLGPGGGVKRRVAKKAQDKLKERVRHTTRRI
jgi:retron-type reverse transcriptase